MLDGKWQTLILVGDKHLIQWFSCLLQETLTYLIHQPIIHIIFLISVGNLVENLFELFHAAQPKLGFARLIDISQPKFLLVLLRRRFFQNADGNRRDIFDQLLPFFVCVYECLNLVVIYFGVLFWDSAVCSDDDNQDDGGQAKILIDLIVKRQGKLQEAKLTRYEALFHPCASGERGQDRMHESYLPTLEAAVQKLLLDGILWVTQ